MPRLVRKRNAPAEEDESDVETRPPQRRRTTESPVSSADEIEGETDATTQALENVQNLARKLVRYALSCEHSRTPIRRQGITDKVLGPESRLFRAVFEKAQEMLGTVWGMKMEELPMKEKVTLTQKRAAQKTEKQSTTSKSWILLSTLPAEYRSSEIIPVPRIPNEEAEATYAGICTLLITLIYATHDSLSEAKLEQYMSRLNIDRSTPLGSTEKLLKRMEKDGYIVKVKDNSSGEEVVDFIVGPRGKLEMDRSAAAEFVKTIYGDSVDEEFDRRLERSLRLSQMTTNGNDANDQTSHARRRGRPPRPENGEADGSEDNDEDNEEDRDESDDG